jgi:hypothetical protein
MISTQSDFDGDVLDYINGITIINGLEWEIICTEDTQIQHINNSISAYTQLKDGAVWIPGIYAHIKTFLNSTDNHNLWVAHKKYIPMIKPNPNKYITKPNIQYKIWLHYQIPNYFYNNKVFITYCINSIVSKLRGQVREVNNFNFIWEKQISKYSIIVNTNYPIMINFIS